MRCEESTTFIVTHRGGGVPLVPPVVQVASQLIHGADGPVWSTLVAGQARWAVSRVAVAERAPCHGHYVVDYEEKGVGHTGTW